MAADSNQLADFKGLPIKDLILDPIISSAEGQKALAATTLDFVDSIGFTTDKDGNKEANVMNVKVPRFVGDSTTPIYENISMPVITLVEIPNIAINDIDVEFTMEVKSHTENKSSSENTQTDKSSTDVKAKASYGGWGFKASGSVEHKNSHTGTVTTKSSNTRSTDFSAKYDIKVAAKQMPQAEGMSRFTGILSQLIESTPENPNKS